jgi:hypothetical protein
VLLVCHAKGALTLTYKHAPRQCPHLRRKLKRIGAGIDSPLDIPSLYPWSHCSIVVIEAIVEIILAIIVDEADTRTRCNPSATDAVIVVEAVIEIIDIVVIVIVSAQAQGIAANRLL